MESAADGTLATPTVRPWDDVGWYSAGPTPGEQITVIAAQGVRRLFRITRGAACAPSQAPLQEIFGDLSGRYLNLITCAGSWIPSRHQSSERLVVYSTLVGPLR